MVLLVPVLVVRVLLMVLLRVLERTNSALNGGSLVVMVLITHGRWEPGRFQGNQRVGVLADHTTQRRAKMSTVLPLTVLLGSFSHQLFWVMFRARPKWFLIDYGYSN